MERMIAMPITKRMEIVLGIQLCHVSWMNFVYKENGGWKALLVIPKHQYCASQCMEHDCHANNEENGDFYEYPSLFLFMDEF